MPCENHGIFYRKNCIINLTTKEGVTELKLSNLFLMLLLLSGGVFLIANESRADWTYTVHRGDTIFNIAQRTGVNPNSIRSRNGVGNSLRIGQRIIIPAGAAAAATATPTRASGDVYLLASLIFAEARAEPYLGQVAVGGVVMNRIQNSKSPKTLAGVVYQPSAFESVSNGIINRPPSSESLKAAQDAISGWDPSGGALYFFNPGKTSNPWIWARRIINQIGGHVFAI